MAEAISKVQTDSAIRTAKRGEPGYLGAYENFVKDLKEMYSEKNVEATKLATVGIPLKALKDWDAGYMAGIFRKHSEYREIFSGLFIDTVALYNAAAQKKVPTTAQLTAARAVRELAGTGSSAEIQSFLNMIKEANTIIVEEEKMKPRKQKFSPADEAKPLLKSGVEFNSFDNDHLNKVILAMPGKSQPVD